MSDPSFCLPSCLEPPCCLPLPVPSTRNQRLCDISTGAKGTAGNHGHYWWRRALGSCSCHVPLAAMNLLPLLVLLAVCRPVHGTWDSCG